MKHIAFIADGNRRWATQNNLLPEMGYNQGLITIENICIWAIKNKIPYISIYAFSTENWSRPKHQIQALMDLGDYYGSIKIPFYVNLDIKVSFIGRRDRVDSHFIETVNTIETATKDCKTLQLNICLDYGGRDEIARAIEQGARTEEEISAVLNTYSPDPDIIVRCGGQYRLSNFMLWQAAYSELIFIPTFFPALQDKDLDAILSEYNQRKRTFGA